MYVIVGIIVMMIVLMMIMSLMITKYYMDGECSYLLAWVVIGVSISISFLNVLMIPLDILVISG